MQTKTYAEILARQGELEQAMAIYRVLIAKKPSDTTLQRRLRELERLASEVDGAPRPKSPEVARLEALLHRIQSRRR